MASCCFRFAVHDDNLWCCWRCPCELHWFVVFGLVSLLESCCHFRSKFCPMLLTPVVDHVTHPHRSAQDVLAPKILCLLGSCVLLHILELSVPTPCREGPRLGGQVVRRVADASAPVLVSSDQRHATAARPACAVFAAVRISVCCDGARSLCCRAFVVCNSVPGLLGGSCHAVETTGVHKIGCTTQECHCVRMR
jgi:hypothetical protein